MAKCQFNPAIESYRAYFNYKQKKAWARATNDFCRAQNLLYYEGGILNEKVKIVYKAEKDNAYIIEYSDDVTDFNGQKKGSFESEGVTNNRMANLIFKELTKGEFRFT